MSTPIRAALIEGSSLQSQVQAGTRALARTHVRDCLHLDVRASFADSLDIDEAFRPAHPNANRWDYLLGHGATGELLALEPHSATSGEIAVVIAKMERARAQLRPHLRDGRRVSQWIWVASGKVAFVPHEKAMLRLAAAGITFVGGLLSAKHLPTSSRSAHSRKGRKRKRHAP